MRSSPRKTLESDRLASQSPASRKRRSAVDSLESLDNQSAIMETPRGRRSRRQQLAEAIDSSEAEGDEQTEAVQSPARNKRMKLKDSTETSISADGSSNNRRQSNRSRRQTNSHNSKDDGDDEEADAEKAEQDSGDDEDEKEFEGDEHLDVDGNPREEGKKFTFKTFNLLERHPTRLYCCMLDLARSFGYNDSFRFMKVNPGLNRIDLEQEERDMVIDMNIIHPVMKYRNVPAISVPDAYVYFGLELFSAGKEAAVTQSSSGWAKSSGGTTAGLPSSQDEGKQRERRAKLLAQGPLLPQLKPAGDPKVEGGDWLYQCAIAAAEFNALARRERQDRLYGENNDNQNSDEGDEADDDDDDAMVTTSEGEEEEESSDDGDDSSEEGVRRGRGRPRGSRTKRPAVAPAAAVKPLTTAQLPQQQERFRHGFHDIHTNIHQLPLNTQPGGMRVQSIGLSVKRLIAGSLQERAKTSAQTGREAVEIHFVKNGDSEKTAAATNLINSKSQLAALLDDRFGYTRDSAERYPLAVMPGQFQGTRPVYSSRFGYSGAQRIPTQQQSVPAAADAPSAIFSGR